jgi:predicted RNA polymerase sigma factor
VRCSQSTPTFRSGSSGRGIGCASWTSILARRLRPSFPLGWMQSLRQRVAELYDRLDRIAPSPLHALNRAVAEANLHGLQAGPERLAAVIPENVPARYRGWHTVISELHVRLGRRRRPRAGLHRGHARLETRRRAPPRFAHRAHRPRRAQGGQSARRK